MKSVDLFAVALSEQTILALKAGRYTTPVVAAVKRF